MSVDAIVIERIEIDSDLSNLSIIESLIDKLCVSIHMNEDLYGNVLISVTEAFNNAVIHGNLLVHTQKVLLEVFEDDFSFSFKISDSGVGFNFLDIPDPTSPENLEKENGRGIFLIKNLSDDVSFTNFNRSGWGLKPKEYNIYNSNAWDIHVKPGLLVLFPSYLQHYTRKNSGVDNRMIVGFNSFLCDDLTGHNENISVKF